MGIGVFAFQHPTDEVKVGAIILSILNISFSRFINIAIVSWLVNCTRTDSKISKKKQFVMWISGLRGAMAYALSIQSTFDFGAAGKVMLYITLIYSIFSIILMGSILHPVL